MRTKDKSDYYNQKVEKKKKGYYQPIVVNDWGYEEYYITAFKSGWGTWGIDGQDPAFKLSVGDKVEVLWEDGTKTKETIKGKDSYYTVSDHGHSNTVKSIALFIETKVKGLKVQIPIEEVYLKKI